LESKEEKERLEDLMDKWFKETPLECEDNDARDLNTDDEAEPEADEVSAEKAAGAEEEAEDEAADEESPEKQKPFTTAINEEE